MFSDEQRATLEALCDTVVPSVERRDDPDGFWARTAGDLGVAAGVEQVVAGIADPAVRGGLVTLLDVLAQQGLTRAPSQLSREQIVRNVAWASPPAAQGLAALQAITLFLFYGAPDPQTQHQPQLGDLRLRRPAVAAARRAQGHRGARARG